MIGRAARGARLAAVGLLAAAAALQAGEPYRVLVYSRTAGFRHESIAAGVAAVRELGAQAGFAVDATEDPSVFTDAALAPYRVVLFLNTTGDVLDEAQQAAFERFVRAGNGFAGVHSAADTEYDWSFYGELLGAYFLSHPAIQTATLHVADAGHPSTAALPASFERTDEWYDFRANPRGTVQVLLTLDEATYTGGKMGPDHPLSWAHEHEGGRAWYTAQGHTSQTYAEPLFRQHLLGGIEWAARAAPVPGLAALRPAGGAGAALLAGLCMAGGLRWRRRRVS